VGTVNNLTRLRPSKRERYRVTIFGSARTQPGHWVYQEVERLSAALSALGCDIVTGGGPGLMQAANEGAREAGAGERSQSIGIRVELPFEQEVNPFVEQAFEHQTFFTRLHQFVLMSDAYVVVPGGIGTVLEAMMIWQLLQVRHLHDTPLIFAGAMWKALVDWAAAHMLRPGFELASAEDMGIPRCVDGADQAIALVRQHHGARLLAGAPFELGRHLRADAAQSRFAVRVLRTGSGEFATLRPGALGHYHDTEVTTRFFARGDLREDLLLALDSRRPRLRLRYAGSHTPSPTSYLKALAHGRPRILSAPPRLSRFSSRYHRSRATTSSGRDPGAGRQRMLRRGSVLCRKRRRGISTVAGLLSTSLADRLGRAAGRVSPSPTRFRL